MGEASLRFATDILKRLGEELNPNPVRGIIELVRNSYDADATKCEIELDNVNDIGGTIKIIDNGDGMSENEILNGWLVLGKSSKTQNRETRLGRLPVGDKGLGRLAAIRMGSKTSLFTKPYGNGKYEYSLDIDWRDYEKADIVESVLLNIKKFKSSSKSPSGATIIIKDLTIPFNRNDIKRLARELVMLSDPFSDNPTGFQIILKAPEYEDLAQKVKNRYFDDAEFKLIASVDSDGRAKAQLKDWQDNLLYEGSHEEIRKKNKTTVYKCPPSEFNLWAFILDKKTFSSRPSSKSEVQDWLTSFGGVHLYIHGIRVAPYGDPGSDWLDMNLSRARSPELRPSTNTSIGRVTLYDDHNEFVQKTDRSGIVEGQAFNELKRFAKDTLDWMARRRIEERDKKRTKQRTQAPKKVEMARKSVQKSIKTLPAPTQRKFEKEFTKYEKAVENETKVLRKEVQLYRTLSTTGITAAVFAHETKQPIAIINKNAHLTDRRGTAKWGKTYSDVLGVFIERILRQATTLQSFTGLTLSYVAHEKRRNSKNEIHKIIKNTIKIFNSLIAERKVTMKIMLTEGNPYLHCSEAAIESILANLVINSLCAFEQSPSRNRIIEIATDTNENFLIIYIRDNGPGIVEIDLKDIWLPGVTSYPNGTGLGLTIVKDTINDLSGNIKAVKKCELGGAEFIIELPILGV